MLQISYSDNNNKIVIFDIKQKQITNVDNLFYCYFWIFFFKKKPRFPKIPAMLFIGQMVENQLVTLFDNGDDPVTQNLKGNTLNL